LKLFKQPEIWW